MRKNVIRDSNDPLSCALTTFLSSLCLSTEAKHCETHAASNGAYLESALYITEILTILIRFVNYSLTCMNTLLFLGGRAFRLIAIRKIADGKRHTDLMVARKLRFDSHAKFMR